MTSFREGGVEPSVDPDDRGGRPLRSSMFRIHGNVIDPSPHKLDVRPLTGGPDGITYGEFAQSGGLRAAWPQCPRLAKAVGEATSSDKMILPPR